MILDETTVTITQLQPFTIYQLQLQKIELEPSMEQWFQIETQEDVPEHFNASFVHFIRMARAIVVSWDLPRCPNGIINSANVSWSEVSEGRKRREADQSYIYVTGNELDNRSVTVENLTPETTYSIDVCVCNR